MSVFTRARAFAAAVGLMGALAAGPLFAAPAFANDPPPVEPTLGPCIEVTKNADGTTSQVVPCPPGTPSTEFQPVIPAPGEAPPNGSVVVHVN
ncbi:hypothetical protein M2272_002210 [Mycobacterium frederiksbergense]|uniref:Intersectin-EH binding protein Ibp1 n=1 Tax=Mycolicibacterium frederiksbergense TaxID=117567 RepID=A0ABT6KXZ4_9MYCO|nr:hypothetical protein [Mycolicibacterium frederiksbergense]